MNKPKRCCLKLINTVSSLITNNNIFSETVAALFAAFQEFSPKGKVHRSGRLTHFQPTNLIRSTHIWYTC